jgi:hypothetical protein
LIARRQVSASIAGHRGSINLFAASALGSFWHIASLHGDASNSVAFGAIQRAALTELDLSVRALGSNRRGIFRRSADKIDFAYGT